MSEAAAPAIARVIADFAAAVRYEDVPPSVLDQAKLLILDALGIATASTTFPFAKSAAAAMQSFGDGDLPVIGLALRLGLRDAAMLNGLLIHGLDYDDTPWLELSTSRRRRFPPLSASHRCDTCRVATCCWATSSR